MTSFAILALATSRAFCGLNGRVAAPLKLNQKKAAYILARTPSLGYSNQARIKSSVKNLFQPGDLDSAPITTCVEDFVASKRTSKQRRGAR
ncbi:hypothetical protein F442_18398 [Phytophthora nicotianae P10297]|uniref:RxLR effector protein n=4 Tax=Phytophthora nicotianae TaxID=4792 RepID=W2PMZ9_PHYN3|nr:hypothetical protein PPTG_24086 [Phytophthora nicotianae INRA-310]ETI35015.1 hypothetical protein F443_18591 [Phytophthora nicotianae P1569]ETM35170.1 hypothetical protein L914_17892 [Phytophthora nicotianae]ETN01395.1 hypothetical protein PPTG_24086 [Phytophthora nicotianae INRA-310]ETP33008.1 hypothetical protein F442_18398 [Phytophthora nicotianae P10297]